MMRLVLLGDLHYHEIDHSIPGLLEARTVFYHTMLENFMNMEADLHISLGDLTNFGSALELQEVYELVRRKDKTFIHVLGNHDLYTQTRREVLEITGQQRYHAIDTETAMLVFLDTTKEMDIEDWGGWMEDEQLQWFSDMVDVSGSKPMLVFGHHPVYNTTARSETEKGSIHPSIDMWHILNRKKGIGVYFNGHTHVDSIVAQNNWTFVQLSSSLDEHGFRIVECEEQQIRISAVDIADVDVAKHAALLHQHMSRYKPNPHARGVDSDREVVVSLMKARQPQT
jgi:Icc protein